jgi:hypothetical protein
MTVFDQKASLPPARARAVGAAVGPVGITVCRNVALTAPANDAGQAAAAAATTPSQPAAFVQPETAVTAAGSQ